MEACAISRTHASWLTALMLLKVQILRSRGLYAMHPAYENGEFNKFTVLDREDSIPGVKSGVDPCPNGGPLALEFCISGEVRILAPPVKSALPRRAAGTKCQVDSGSRA